MIDIEQAKRTPSRYFMGPQDVVEHDRLTKADKVEILLRWRHEALKMETNRSKRPQPRQESQLREVLNGLYHLGVRT
ncbi:MAG: hypothetical protein PVF33_00100 [Candidatus Latescibacterota bacterium]|jgi:hypothetical protein